MKRIIFWILLLSITLVLSISRTYAQYAKAKDLFKLYGYVESDESDYGFTSFIGSDGKYILYNNKKVIIHDVIHKKSIEYDILKIFGSNVKNIQPIFIDGQTQILALKYNEVQLWNINTQKSSTYLNDVQQFWVSRNGEFIAIKPSSNFLQIYSLKDKKQLGTGIQLHGNSSALHSHSGDYKKMPSIIDFDVFEEKEVCFLMNTMEGHVLFKVYSIQKGNLLNKFDRIIQYSFSSKEEPCYASSIYFVKYLSNGKVVTSSSITRCNTVALWNLNRRDVIYREKDNIYEGKDDVALIRVGNDEVIVTNEVIVKEGVVIPYKIDLSGEGFNYSSRRYSRVSFDNKYFGYYSIEKGGKYIYAILELDINKLESAKEAKRIDEVERQAEQARIAKAELEAQRKAEAEAQTKAEAEQAKIAQAQAVRDSKIKANSNKALWKMGNKICNDVSGGVVVGTLNQWNEDKSMAQIKVVTSPGGSYEGESLTKNNLIWIKSSGKGWHLCLDDEIQTSLSNDNSSTNTTSTSLSTNTNNTVSTETVGKYAKRGAYRIAYKLRPSQLRKYDFKVIKHKEIDGVIIHMSVSYQAGNQYSQWETIEGVIICDKYGTNAMFIPKKGSDDSVNSFLSNIGLNQFSDLKDNNGQIRKKINELFNINVENSYMFLDNLSSD